MKKSNILLIFLIAVFLMMPAVSAWTPTTHKRIVDNIFDDLPVSVQKHLDIGIMRNGAVAPDSRNDTYIKNHWYPYCTSEIIRWSNKGKTAYKNKEYGKASFCFGVVSHYVSDAFCAPHAYVGEGLELHTKYEAQKIVPTKEVWYYSDSKNLTKFLIWGDEKGEESWTKWVTTKDNTEKIKIAQSNLNRARSAAYSVIINCF